jgi:hypothetical protein
MLSGSAAIRQLLDFQVVWLSQHMRRFAGYSVKD